MKSYCVKQRKQTECIKPEGYKTTKKWKTFVFCSCAECGITKTKFVSAKKGAVIQLLTRQNMLKKHSEKYFHLPITFLIDIGVEK